MLTKIVVHVLQGQVIQWKHKDSKVVVVDVRLAKYDTFFKVHTFVKLESMAWQQKIRNMGVKWNELKGELNAMLDVAPPPYLGE